MDKSGHISGGDGRLEAGRRRWELLLLLALALIQLVLLSTDGADPFKDDAYICLRYARNALEGHGLVYNVGELVEGFTTPLWTLLSVLVLYARIPEVFALKALGGLSFLGLVLTTWRTADEARLPSWLRLGVGLTVALCGAVAYWSLSGLETIAFALAVMAGLRQFINAARGGRPGTPLGGLFFGVAALLRPEALAWFFLLVPALVLGGRGWSQRREGRGDSGARIPGEDGADAGDPGRASPDNRASPDYRASPDNRASPDYRDRSWSGPGAWTRGTISQQVLGTLLPFLLLAGGWEVFRLVYYHAWLPNTFFAKVERQWYVLARGLEYLWISGLTTPLFLLLLPVLVVPRAWRRPEVTLSGILVGFHLAYIVAVGGDYMSFGRFLMPVIAPLALAWGAALSELAKRPGGRAAQAGKWALMVTRALVIVTPLYSLAPYVIEPDCREPDEFLERFRRAGLWLAENVKPEAVVATPAVGAVGYLGGCRILDTMGIVDAHIAGLPPPNLPGYHAEAGHARGSGEYVLERSPDIILMANIWIRPVPLQPQHVASNQFLLSLTDRLLMGNPRFLEKYSILSYPLPEGDWFGMAIRRDSRYHPDHPEYNGPTEVLR